MLTTLNGCPDAIDGNFDCGSNKKLTSLEAGPTAVSGDCRCRHCSLTSLKGVPKKVVNFVCRDNKNLKSLDFGLEMVDESYEADDCNLTSLRNIHKYTQQILGDFYCGDNPIKSHMLGLLLIKGLTYSACNSDDNMYKPIQIINNYLKQPMSKQRMFDCQEELIQAGFKEYAQL